jgi:hypothetical protein
MYGRLRRGGSTGNESSCMEAVNHEKRVAGTSSLVHPGGCKTEQKQRPPEGGLFDFS